MEQLLRAKPASQEKGSMGMPDVRQPDTAETVIIGALPLMKMLKHARAGVPFEVMGLMLGEFIDDFKISVCDVFAMPQTGTGVSVEAVDPVYQTTMMSMLSRTGRNENVVGWYHSHPGFGCWLSSTDLNTQRHFEMLHERAIAIVLDPIQSVKGKVVLDAFRSFDAGNTAQQGHMSLLASMMGIGPAGSRDISSNLGNLERLSVQQVVHGINKLYYKLNVEYRMNDFEQQMLMALNKKSWPEMLTGASALASVQSTCNLNTMTSMKKFVKLYKKRVEEDAQLSKEEQQKRRIGTRDPKVHLGAESTKMLDDTLLHSLNTAVNAALFGGSAYDTK